MSSIDPKLEAAIEAEVAAVAADERHPTRIAYDRARAAYPNGGDAAKGAFFTFLREERAKRDGMADRSGPKAPDVDEKTGVPMCSHTSCPKYAKFLGRCTEENVDDPNVCIPAVRDMVLEIDARKDAADPAFDEIVQLCGLAKTWEYPGQVVRDVADALKKRDADLKNLESRIEAITADRTMFAEQLRGELRDATVQALETAGRMRKELDAARTELRDVIAIKTRLDEERTRDLHLVTRQGKVIGEMREKLRIAEAVRDDARAASQRYLDEKREIQERLDAALATGMELVALVSKMTPTGPQHSRECGTAYRGCAPDCAFAKAQEPESEHDQYDRATGELGAPLAQTKACECSLKYLEIAPGVHAKYCPLAGLPLDDGRKRWRCEPCDLTFRSPADAPTEPIETCQQCGKPTTAVTR